MDLPLGGDLTKYSVQTDYSDEYRIGVFTKWFLSGKPGANHLRKIIDPDPVAKMIPPAPTLQRWILEDFTPYAIQLDGEIAKRLEQQLVERKVETLNRHADLGKKMQNIGEQYLDSLDSEDIKRIGVKNAVQLLIRGVEIERDSTVIPDYFAKYSKMDDNALLDEIKRLAENAPVLEFGANDLDDGE